MSKAAEAIQLQDALLPGVSRTFALTIPQLPDGVRVAVTNAYLLCRLADTIEDDPSLDTQSKHRFHQQLAASLQQPELANELATALDQALSEATPAEERELARTLPQVLQVTAQLPPRQRHAVARCVQVMCEDMPRFQEHASPTGLPDLKALGQYCYTVAGVVGEMLTEVFCDYSRQIASRQKHLMRHAVSFGQGLQLTNILKDVWDDRAREVCWLPNKLFARHGVNLAELEPGSDNPGFASGIREMIGITHGSLRRALWYVQMIPKEEKGIRRFCLWAIGLALLTLRKVHRNPNYSHSSEVKVSRRTVRLTIAITELVMRSGRVLDWTFKLLARGLPAPAPGPEMRPEPAGFRS